MRDIQTICKTGATMYACRGCAITCAASGACTKPDAAYHSGIPKHHPPGTIILQVNASGTAKALL